MRRVWCWLICIHTLAEVAAIEAASYRVGSELPVSVTRYTTAKPPTLPAIASDGEDYLVAWVERRNQQPQLRAKRISARGESYDFTGIVISEDVGPPSVVWNGVTYFMVWQGRELRAARVSRDGQLLDQRMLPRVIPGASFYQPVVGWNGTNHMVVFDAGHRLYGILLNASAEVVRTVVPIFGGRGQGNQSITSDGSSFLVVWNEFFGRHGEVWASYVGPNGEPLTPTGILLDDFVPQRSLETAQPQVGWNGERFLVIWTDAGVRAVELLGGDVAGPAFQIVSGQMSHPVLAAAGGEFLVVWNEPVDPLVSQRFDVGGARVRGGRVIGRGRVAASNSSHPQPLGIASNGRTFLVVWSSFSESTSRPIETADGYLLPVGFDFGTAPMAKVIISIRAVPQLFPSITAGRDHYVALWTEASMLCARIRPDGGLIDPEGVVMAPPLNIHPRAAWNGENYLVTWSESNLPRLKAAIFTEDLVRITEPIHLSDFGYSHDVVWDGSHFLVVFIGLREISVSRVTREGVVVRSDVLASNELQSFDVRAVFDGTQTLVVWSQSRRCPDGNQCWGVFGRRVRADGTLLDSSPITISLTRTRQGSPAVTFGAGTFFVTWLRAKENRRTALLGTRISAEGVVLDRRPETDGIPIAELAETQVFFARFGPAVTWDGDVYLVLGIDRGADGSFILFAVRVSSSGALLEDRIEIASASTEISEPKVLTRIPGESAVVYNRFAREQIYGHVPRTFIRILRRSERARLVRP